MLQSYLLHVSVQSYLTCYMQEIASNLISFALICSEDCWSHIKKRKKKNWNQEKTGTRKIHWEIFLPEVHLVCRDLINVILALITNPSDQGMAHAVGQPCCPVWHLALGAIPTSLCFLWPRNTCSSPPSSQGSPGKGHSHGLRTLQNENLPLFLTSLFVKDFWFIFNSAPLALPKPFYLQLPFLLARLPSKT